MKLLSNLENLDNIVDGLDKVSVHYIDLVQDMSYSNPLIFWNMEPGLYINTNMYNTTAAYYCKLDTTHTGNLYVGYGCFQYIRILKAANTAAENETIAEIYAIEIVHNAYDGVKNITYDYKYIIKKDTSTASGLVLDNNSRKNWLSSINSLLTVYCPSSSQAAKIAHTDSEVQSNTYFLLATKYNNSAQSALTLNINNTAAKPIYINGEVSSSTNYTIPKGTYLCYYDGTNYYINTDGTIPKVIHSSNDSIKNIIEISYADYQDLVTNNTVDPNTEYHIKENGTGGSIETIVRQLIQEDAERKHPIGSLEFNVSGTNPNTYLGFGTWELWGAGKVPVGVDTGDTDFNISEKSGGAKTASTSYTPQGTNTGGSVNSHTYTPQGVNTGGSVNAHTYTPQGTNKNGAVTLNAVTLSHSGGAVQSHTLTVTEIPSHDHIIYTPRYYYSEPGGGNDILGADTSPVTTVQERKTDVTGGGGGHSHGFTQPSQHTFTPSVNTFTQPTFTGTQATLSHTVTQPTFSGTQATLSHTVTQPTFSGTAATITESTVQPYITCYMWKRTA